MSKEEIREVVKQMEKSGKMKNVVFAKKVKGQEFGREVQEITKELDKIDQRLRDVGNIIGQQGHVQLQSLIEKASDNVRDAWTSLQTAKGLM